MREFLSGHPAVVGGTAAVVLLTSIAFGVWRSRPGPEPEPLQEMVYFYDLNTKELFERPLGTEPPVETESGPHQGMPAGVRAYVFSCGPLQEDDDEWFVGVLETAADAVPEDQRPSGVAFNPDTEEGGLVIRRPTDDRWYNPNGSEGRRIMDELGKRCPEGTRLESLNPLPKPR